MQQIEPTLLIDALPYVDNELNDPVVQNTVRLMIEQEMSKIKFNKEEYVGHIAVPDWNFKGSTLGLKEQFISDATTGAYLPISNRISENTTTYSANQRDAIQYEYNNISLINLQLSSRYASLAWKKFNSELEQTQQKLSHDINKIRADVDQMNRKRKLDQLKIKDKLELDNHEWMNLALNNVELERECEIVESQIKKLKVQHESIKT
ncbi:pre-mRNA-splicing factor SPF27 [Acrasis kona]|uniref:Pre-mRNA-splicing factor SPF27 n=1 Tax=Acrasis kona TaxID=1008807 RepID=A0AAW2YY21_9EUKA